VNVIALNGCRADTLAGYLSALGLLRVVARQTDPSARLHWARDVAVLTTRLTGEELTAWLTDEYRPSPIISPWNAGSGFAGNGKSPAAERVLDLFRNSREERFAVLREAIAAADRVVAIARSRGWEGGPLWAEDRKADVVRLCRNMLPDDALPWIDTAVTLTTDDLQFSPLTGTGGNFGRQDLSVTFLQRLAEAAGPNARRARSLQWAEAALFGREDVPYLRDTVGQYDPGRAGGVLSTTGNDDAGFANPWRLVLTLEGALLFASAVTRRNQASAEAGSLPFLARTSAVGYDSAAVGETVKGEQWIPLWPRPAGLAEIEHLIGEGRAQWNGRPARTGLEFALAVASLGVDRGLSAFRRYVIATRFGQSPLAVAVDRLPVRRREQVGLLREPYEWIQRLTRMSLPAGVATAVRRTEQAIYDAAAGGGPAALQRFVIEFGRLHATVSRSGTVRGQLAPFRPRDPGDWVAALPQEDELWVAAGFATLYDATSFEDDRSLRGLLTRVQEHRSQGRRSGPAWADRPPTGLDLNAVTLPRALAQAHRLRVISAVARRSARSAKERDTQQEATLDVAYPSGLALPVHLVEAYALGLLDDHLIADYLAGLLALGCQRKTTAPWQRAADRPSHPALAALLPFFATEPLAVRHLTGDQEDPPPTRAGVEKVRLTPRPQWIPQLIASGVEAVAPEVLRRLAIAGCPPVLEEDDLGRMPIDGIRLAGALLLRVSPSARVHALVRVSAVTSAPKETEGALP